MATTPQPSLVVLHDTVLGLIDRGLHPIPVPLREKRPQIANWPDLVVTRENYKEYFPQPSNVGLLLTDLADIDLDSPFASAVAHHFLLPSRCVWGRASKPRSHVLYKPVGRITHRAFEDPEGGMLVELRTGRHHSLLPPSLNPANELVEWSNEEALTSIPEVPAVLLEKSVALLAVAALLAKLHPHHTPDAGAERQAFRLAVSGVLARRLDLASAELVWKALLIAGGDTKWRERESWISDTVKKIAAGESVPGIPKLQEQIGEKRCEKILEWCALVDADRAAPGSSNTKSSAAAMPKEIIWGNPEPLAEEELPVAEFDYAMVPEPLRDFIADVSRRLPSQPDFTFASLLAALSTCFASRMVIYAKAHDRSFVVRPNLWIAMVARIGGKKSPLLKQSTGPLVDIERMWQLEDKNLEEQYKLVLNDHEARIRAWEKRREKAYAKAGGQFGEPRPEPPPPPPAKRFLMVTDPRYERLFEILQDNPGLLILQEELASFLDALEQPQVSNIKERELYMKAHSGDLHVTQNRIGRGDRTVYDPLVSFLGAWQPGPMHSYQLSIRERKRSDDGFLQRFLNVYPDKFPYPPDWKVPDFDEDKRAETCVRKIFERVLELPRKGITARFTPEAQQVAYEWYEYIPKLIEDEDAALAGHYLKLEGIMPRIAGLWQGVTEAAAGRLETRELQMDRLHASMACQTCEYFASHAKRVYQGLAHPELTTANTLGRRIEHGKFSLNSDEFTVREIQQARWANVPQQSSVIRGALELLAEKGWVAKTVTMPGEHGGRKGETWQLNPKLRGSQHA